MTHRDKIVNKIDTIPLLSKSAQSLIEMLSSDSYSVKHISDIIAQDSILSARIIKLINSSYFSFATEITSVERALPYIGDKLLLATALESSAGALMSTHLKGYSFRQGELWEHSLKTAIAAKKLTSYSPKKIEEGTAYTAGLLHDIGKAILSSYLSMNIEKISIEIKEDPETNYLDLEEELLGINHCEAGALLTSHWQLPELFTSASLYHHTPSEAPENYRHISYIIHIADLLAMMTGSGTALDAMHYNAADDFFNIIPISQESFQHILLETEDEYEKIKIIF